MNYDEVPPPDHPMVSVIIPTYEDAQRAVNAIDSVRSQTYERWHILVVDGSNVERLQQIASSDERIEYHYQRPTGIAAARNHGLENARGEYVAFLDADDCWCPEKLERQMHEARAGSDFIYTDIIIVDGEIERRQSSLPVDDPTNHHVRFFREGGIPCSSVLFDKSLATEERFDTSLTTGEDRHMWVRLLRKGHPSRVAEPLVRYHRREGSLTDDFVTLYEDERRVISDLCERFEELRSYKDVQIARADYKLAKRLLRRGSTGDAVEARRKLITAIRGGFRDYRAVALFGVALLPMGHPQAVRLLERLEEGSSL